MRFDAGLWETREGRRFLSVWTEFFIRRMARPQCSSVTPRRAAHAELAMANAHWECCRLLRLANCIRLVAAIWAGHVPHQLQL